MMVSWRYLGPRKASLHAAAGSLVAIAVLLGDASGAQAESACATAFEKWSKLSSTRLRTQAVEGGAGPAGTRREACMQSEAVRQDLLQALAKARSTCEDAPWLDQAATQTKAMIDINSGFIGSVPLCRPEAPAKIVEAEPVPPRPAPRPRACLDISQINPQRYVLSNRKCSGSRVLAVIEKRGPSGKVDCKGYTIDRRMAVATLKHARPQINYECVLEQGNCSKAQVAAIFPECDW